MCAWVPQTSCVQGGSGAPQCMQKRASGKCPSLKHSGQVRVVTGVGAMPSEAWRCAAISAVTMPVGTPAQQHHHRRNEAAQVRLGRDVAKAHGGHRGDGPIHRGGNGGEAVRRPLDHVHQCAQNQHHHEHAGNEHRDLASAGVQGQRQTAVLGHVGRELEHAKHAQQAQHAHVDQHMRFENWWRSATGAARRPGAAGIRA